MKPPKTITAKIVVPEWAKWVATDEGGQIYAFSEEPIIVFGEWYQRLADDRHEFVCRTTKPRNWRKTLRRVR